MDEETRSTPLHSYKPLRGPEHIRILVLKPSVDHTSPIEFSFQQARLLKLADTYEAVSYTWGEDKRTFPLCCNDGTVVLATENLDQMLRILRLKHDERRLWVDAACIDQSDDREKATQVPFMVWIFRGAKRVLAWLGRGQNGEEKAVEILKDMSRWSGTHVSENAIHRKDVDRIEALLSSAWFSRMWIIQEVVFNVDVVLLCGGLEISWQRFFAALHMYAARNPPDPSSGLFRKLEALFHIVHLWKSHCMVNAYPRGADAGGEILDMLEEFSEYNCSNPRDRIFALYSMATDLQNPSTTAGSLNDSDRHILMEIDYSRSVLHTYRAFSIACMEAHRTQDLLAATAARLGNSTNTLWPSWVPDWRIRSSQASLHPRLHVKTTLEYRGADKDAILLFASGCLSLPMRGWSTIRIKDIQSNTVQTQTSFQRILSIAMLKSKDNAGPLASDLAALFNFSDRHRRLVERLLLRLRERVQADQVLEPDDPLNQMIAQAMEGRRFFVAEIWKYDLVYLGICDEHVQEGDSLLIPKILRWQQVWELGRYRSIARVLVVRRVPLEEEKKDDGLSNTLSKTSLRAAHSYSRTNTEPCRLVGHAFLIGGVWDSDVSWTKQNMPNVPTSLARDFGFRQIPDRYFNNRYFHLL